MKFYYEDLESDHHDELVVDVQHYELEIEDFKVVGRHRYLRGRRVEEESLSPELERELTARFKSRYESDEKLREYVREELLEHLEAFRERCEEHRDLD